MPLLPGEELVEYEARLKAEWERTRPQPKRPQDMSRDEERTALALLNRPASMPVVTPFEGVHLNQLTSHQRAEAARQLGISHLFPSFR